METMFNKKDYVEGVEGDVQLSRHFRLSEFTRSATAVKLGIDNDPDVDSVEALQQLCVNVLEPLRERFGVLRITSGFRSAAVNKAVGGALRSQHLRGEAADIHCSSLEVGKKMFEYICSHLPFDQLLLEMKGDRIHCLHVSYVADRENRHRVNSSYQIA